MSYKRCSFMRSMRQVLEERRESPAHKALVTGGPVLGEAGELEEAVDCNSASRSKPK